jgi:hypothetical protein
VMGLDIVLALLGLAGTAYLLFTIVRAEDF